MRQTIIVAVILLSTIFSYGQKRIDHKTENKIKAQKVAFITQALELTPEEAERFWPLYNEYSRKLRDLRIENKVKPKRLTEEEANRLLDEFFDIDQKKLVLRKNYYDRFRHVLPASKVVKLRFAEKKFKLKLLNRIRKKRNRR